MTLDLELLKQELVSACGVESTSVVSTSSLRRRLLEEEGGTVLANLASVNLKFALDRERILSAKGGVDFSIVGLTSNINFNDLKTAVLESIERQGYNHEIPSGGQDCYFFIASRDKDRYAVGMTLTPGFPPNKPYLQFTAEQE